MSGFVIYNTKYGATREYAEELAKRLGDWASFNPVAIKENTELYDLAVREGYFIPRKIDAFSGESQLDNYCNSNALSTYEILRLTNLAYKKFYLRPFHVIRLLFLMTREGTIWNFCRIFPYIVKRIFGEHKHVKR